MSSVSALSLSLAARPSGRLLALAVACLAIVASSRLAAQTPGTLDTSFKAADTGSTFYTQVLESVNGVPLLFVAGDLDGLDVVKPDGTLTGTFLEPDFGSAARIIYTAVPELVPQADGTYNLLVGGQFGRSVTQLEATRSAENLVRLTPTAALDTTYNLSMTGKGTNGFVTAILPLYDGGSVVAGEFDTYNNITHPHIVRLTQDGVPVDNSTFDPALAFDATVLSLAAQQPYAAGTIPQILAAGQFSNVDGQSHQKLARLNADGSVDTSFTPNFDDRTTVVVSQPDGKILVGGDFENVNGTPVKHIVRLNADGSVDPTFTASVTGQPFGFVNPPAVFVIQLLNDGSMYLGGNFTTVNGVKRSYLAKVDANGVLDPTFDPGDTIINAVQSLTVQPTDGNLIVGETLSRTNGNNVRPPSLIRLFGEAPVITLSANRPTATEMPIHYGAFTLKRSGVIPASGAFTVYLSLTGTAKMPANYRLSPRAKYLPAYDLYAVTFPANADTVKLPVMSSGAEIFKAPFARTVTLTVVGDPTGAETYTVGETATVTITTN